MLGLELVRNWVDVTSTSQKPREPQAPDLVRQEAFIEWGGPASFFESDFRAAASNLGFNTDPKLDLFLHGDFVEEGRTWEDFIVANPEDSSEQVIVRRTSGLALRSKVITDGMFEQVSFTFANVGEDQTPHYVNHKDSEAFTPVVLDPLTQLVGVSWGGPVMLILFGHYPETSMSREAKALIGVKAAGTLYNPIDIESGESYPTGVGDKQVHYKGLFNVEALLIQPDKDPPEDDPDAPPPELGWVGAPPEPHFQPDYHVGTIDNTSSWASLGDYISGPGTREYRGRIVLYAGFDYVQKDPVQLPDGTWVTQQGIVNVRYPDPQALVPDAHLSGLNGSGAIFDDHGHVGSITIPGDPTTPPPEPVFEGIQHQWRHEYTGSNMDDSGASFDTYWFFRLWNKTGEQPPEEDKGCPVQVCAAIVNVTKPLITMLNLNPNAMAYTLGVRYGGVEKDIHYDSNNKRLAKMRLLVFQRSQFDNVMSFLSARADAIDPDHKYASLDKLLDEFNPPFPTLQSGSQQIQNVTTPYGDKFDIVVNLAAGLDISVQ